MSDIARLKRNIVLAAFISSAIIVLTAAAAVAFK